MNKKPYFAAIDKFISKDTLKEDYILPKNRLIFPNKLLKDVIKSSSNILLQRLRNKIKNEESEKDDLTFYHKQYTLIKVEDIDEYYFKIKKVYSDTLYCDKISKYISLA